MYISVFLVIMFIVLAALAGDAHLTPLQWVVLGFASYFGGRSISELLVFAWLRKLFVSWQGTVKVPEYKSVLTEFIHCPYCTGTWVAVVLYTLLVWLPSVGTPLLFILGAAGVHAVLTSVTHKVGW